MRRITDLPDTLPIFPIDRALLLPRARLPMNLFEPRYLQMFEDVLKTNRRMIGLSLINPNDTQSSLGVNTIGCAGRIVQFSETEDGCYLITLFGESRFRILEQIESFNPYMRARVSWEGFEMDLNNAAHDPEFDRDKLFIVLKRFFKAKGISTDLDTLEQADDELLINSLSMIIEFTAEDRQALLEAPHIRERRETLISLIEYALSPGKNNNRMQ